MASDLPGRERLFVNRMHAKSWMLLIAACVAVSASLPSTTSHDLPYLHGAAAGPALPHAKRTPDSGIGNHILANLSLGGVCFGAGEEYGWGNGNEGLVDPITGVSAGSADLSHLDYDTGGRARPTLMGRASDWIITGNLAPMQVWAVYCQDLNGDGLCGAAALGQAQGSLCRIPGIGASSGPTVPTGLTGGTPICPLRSEPYVEFCEDITIREGLSGPVHGEARRLAGFLPCGGTGTSDSGDWADSALANWATEFPFFVPVAGAQQGNALEGGTCGLLPAAVDVTTGSVAWVRHGP